MSGQLVRDSARYYDPTLGRFISADTIAPERSDPQTRNRYSYVLNNPLKYTDPTGHCGKSTDVAAETKACDQEITNLEAYDIQIGDLTGGLWSSNQIRNVGSAAALMVTELFGGKLSTFLDKIGRVTMYQSAEKTGVAWYSGSKESEAITEPGWLTAKITFYQNGFNDKFQHLVVHELGHAWDIKSWGLLNHDLKIATKSGWYDGQYTLKGITTDYALKSGTNTEDWAESVAETVFNPPTKGGIGIDRTREEVVRRHAR